MGTTKYSVPNHGNSSTTQEISKWIYARDAKDNLISQRQQPFGSTIYRKQGHPRMNDELQKTSQLDVFLQQIEKMQWKNWGITNQKYKKVIYRVGLMS